LSVAPGGLTLRSAGLKKRKKAPGEKLLALTRFPDNAECRKNLASSSRQPATNANRHFQFQKRGQLLIRSHNETVSSAPMRVNNPERSPVGIHV